MSSWTDATDEFLNKIRLNSIFLYNRHVINYNEYKSTSKWFDVPIIIISTLSASFSVGTQSYLQQEVISSVSCSISMIITILSGIKLYLGLDTLIQTELELSRDFNLLSLNIFKTLQTSRDTRTTDAHEFLNETFNIYTTLISKSNVLRTSLQFDLLMPVDIINEEIKLPNEMTGI